MLGLTFRPFASSSRAWNSAYLSMNGKYVGRQYYDNTSSAERSIPAFFVADLSLGCEFPLGRGLTSEKSRIGLSLHVNNVFNNMYYADAWVYRAYFKNEDTYYTQTGIFPQAPLNMMLKISWKF